MLSFTQRTQVVPSAADHPGAMNITIIAIANGLFVLLTVAALTAVMRLGLRLRSVAAASAALDAHQDELSRAA
jgi:hypothetical protein